MTLHECTLYFSDITSHECTLYFPDMTSHECTFTFNHMVWVTSWGSPWSGIAYTVPAYGLLGGVHPCKLRQPSWRWSFRPCNILPPNISHENPHRGRCWVPQMTCEEARRSSRDHDEKCIHQMRIQKLSMRSRWSKIEYVITLRHEDEKRMCRHIDDAWHLAIHGPCRHTIQTSDNAHTHKSPVR